MTDPKQPLWLPRGSVRALIAFSLLAIVAVTLFVPVAAEATSTAMVALLGIAIRDYFSSRAGQ